jgi:hypothetical protein
MTHHNQSQGADNLVSHIKMHNAWGAKCNMMYEQEQPKHITHKSYFTKLFLNLSIY